MKKIALIGGAGRIGRILYENLKHKYDLLLVDIRDDNELPVTIADVSDFESLKAAIPENTNVIFDLTAYEKRLQDVDSDHFEGFQNVYARGIFNVLGVARQHGIPKVLYASSIHVNWFGTKSSKMRRRIRENEYPRPDNIYGAFKLFGESLVRIYSQNHGIQAICLRLGMVTLKNKPPRKNPENSKVYLFHEDLAMIVEAAIEKEINFGIFNAVSLNKGRMLSMRKTIKTLGLRRIDFKLGRNSSRLHRLHKKLACKLGVRSSKN